MTDVSVAAMAPRILVGRSALLTLVFCGSGRPGRLMPKALHPVLLIGGDLPRLWASRVETEVCDRAVDHLVRSSSEVEATDDAALITYIVERGDRAGCADLRPRILGPQRRGKFRGDAGRHRQRPTQLGE